MVLQLLDFLSPRITLYYYGRKRHSSSIGGIFTIIMVLGCLCYISYIIAKLFFHKSPTSQYYRKYYPDAGYFPFDNKEGIFHYFQLYTNQNESTIEDFDPKYIRIFMSRLYETYQNNPSLLSQKDHWVYDKCKENDFPSFNLINNVNKSICLKYFYNSTLGKYFSIDDKSNFVSPYLIHGSSNAKNLFLSTVVEKCQNDSITSQIFGICESEEQINEYLKINIKINLFILNHEVDTFNYLNPISNFTTRITNELNSNEIPLNNINIAPLQIETHDGFVAETTKKKITYVFEENKKSSEKNSEISEVLSIYYYWLQNKAQIYERRYKNLIDDIIPRIGGIIQLIYYLFYFINIVFHKLNIIRDTRDLICEWNKTLEEVNHDRSNFSRIVRSLQDVRSIELKNNLTVSKSKSPSNKIDLDSRINNSKRNDLNIINTRPRNTIVFCGNEISDNSKNENLILKFNDNSKMINSKIGGTPKNNNVVFNQSNSNAELNIEKSLVSGNNLILNKNRKNTYYQRKPSDLMMFNSDEILIKGRKRIKSEFNLDDNHIPIANLLENLDKNDHNIFDKIKKKKKKDKIINKNEKKPKKGKDLYKLRPAKISVFNHYFTLCQYVCSVIFCIRKNKNAVFVLEQFRKKLLSEEHFFRTNIFLCLAEKFIPLNNIGKKIDIVELYENL